MKHITILVPEGAILGSIEGPHKIFMEVNARRAARRQPAAFQVQFVGLTQEVRLQNGLFTVHTDHTLETAGKTDVVIVPAVHGDMPQALEHNQAFIPWIVNRYKAGAEIASLCVGAFLLAATGLLDGRRCSTHWVTANDFRTMFPNVHLVDDKIITDEHGIYSSGGAYSYLNLILYLVEKYVSRDMAVICAKIFAIEIDRSSQSSFIMFQGQKEHDDTLVKQAQEFIESNYRKKITVDHLASTLAMGRRNLERRFKKATSNTVVEYIQRVKVEAAKISLESSRDNVNAVMSHVGYTDPKAFRTVFKSITGLSPIQYRNKYNQEIAV